MENDVLNEREKFILRIFIKEYCNTKNPISSKYLKERYQLDYSSATIRNIFAQLEEKGYLFKPHTSSGRVPTDKAFRYYVDHLITLNKYIEVELRNIKDIIEEKLIDINYVMNVITDLITQFTNEISFTLGLTIESQKINYVKLSMVSKNQVLALIFLQSGIILNKVFLIDENNVNRRILKITENLINENAKGQSITQIVEEIKNHLNNISGELKQYENLIQQITQKIKIVMSEFEEMHINLSPDKINNINDIALEKKLKSVLNSFNELPKQQKILIGNELQIKGLEDYTMITSPFKIEDDIAGVLGIFGNKAMFYEFNIDFVAKLSEIISSVLTERYKKWR